MAPPGFSHRLCNTPSYTWLQVDVLFAGQLSGLIRRRRDDEAAFTDPAKVACCLHPLNLNR